jgi:hypothetical protein
MAISFLREIARSPLRRRRAALEYGPAAGQAIHQIARTNEAG